MLTLTRRTGEVIVVGDAPAAGEKDTRVYFIVKDIRRNQVRVGVVCPAELPIARGELLDDVEDRIWECRSCGTLVLVAHGEGIPEGWHMRAEGPLQQGDEVVEGFFNPVCSSCIRRQTG